MPEIIDYSLYRAECVLAKPIADSTHTLTGISFVVLRIALSDGTTGESYLLSFQYSPRAIAGALGDICPIMLGRSVCDTVAVWAEMDAASEYFGKEGINRQAQALCNVAMWDAWSRSLDVPVWKLFGRAKDSIPVYGSGGWLSYTENELIDEVVDYKARGFRAVKIKVGKPDWREDLLRLHLVREAVGKGIDIMMDANQGMALPEAIRLAKAASELDIYWFEEPLDHSDFDGYGRLKESAGISLAMGEREYSLTPLRELLMRGALDIWQPDVIRIGGVEKWRESAALAAAFHKPVLPHYYKDYDVPLLCTVPNGAGAESFDWIDTLIDNPMRIENGMAFPHDGAGWGFRFKDSSLTEIK